MALINCPECNTLISDKARECPKCAYPINLQSYTNTKEKGLTVEDGVKTGCGMFIVLPLIIIGIIFILFIFFVLIGTM